MTQEWKQTYFRQYLRKFAIHSLFRHEGMCCAQSCPTLYDPMHNSLPGFSACGIFQARILSGLPFPSPGYIPNPGTESEALVSPALAGRFFTARATWKAQTV